MQFEIIKELGLGCLRGVLGMGNNKTYYREMSMQRAMTGLTCKANEIETIVNGRRFCLRPI